MRADELPRDGQQAIQRQQQGTPQVNHHGFLCGCEHGSKALGRVRAICKDLTLLALVDRLLGDAKARRAGTLAVSLLAAISTRTAGVVRAFLCKAINMARLSVWFARTLSIPSARSDHEEGIALGESIQSSGMRQLIKLSTLSSSLFNLISCGSEARFIILLFSAIACAQSLYSLDLVGFRTLALSVSSFGTNNVMTIYLRLPNTWWRLLTNLVGKSVMTMSEKFLFG